MATKKEQSKNLFQRLTKLFRSGPVIKKKIRTLDTTIAVADKTKSSGALLFQKSIAPTYATITANAYNLSERLMRYQDFQEMEYTPEIAAALDIYADETCLSGDSIIPLLDGTKPTVRELFEKGTENFWVYSYDLSTSKIVPGLATKVIKTGKKKIYRISLDDDTCLRLTDNHKILLSDGTYVEVKDLKVGSSVRSLHIFNHHVVSIVEENVEEVFDLEVKEWHNFAVTATPGSTSYVFVHNCAQDEKGRVLHIYSDNEKIKEVLEDLFYNTLNVEFNLRSWARNLVKYGDFFLYNDVSPDYGVVSAFPVPVNEIEREENYDREDPFAVRYRWVTLGNRVLENWEITHFRLLGNDMFLPYGSSVIEPARRIWRQLILIEDAMLVYRVVRAPERRVFYIDVANIPASDVPTYVEEQRKNLRTNQVIDRTTGRVDLRYNPLSVDEDYFIPVRGIDTGTKIETLAGGQNAAAVEDVAYIQKKLFAALKIPRAYLGYDEMLSSKATLAQEDIRFSRTINVIQRVMLAELNKLAIIHLYAHGFDSDDLQNFTLHLSNPSTVAQLQKLELWKTKFEIGGSAPEGYVNKDFIRKQIWGLNDDECKTIDRNRMKDKIVDATIESAQAEGGDTGGGGDEGGGGGDELFGGGEESGGGEETPSEENAGETPKEETPGVQLLTSFVDNDDEETFPIKIDPTQVEVPVKAKSELDRILYNKSRRRTNGPSKTHMPDFRKMTSIDNRAMEDPYDMDWMKSVVSNPFGEGKERTRTNISPDLVSMLGKWSDRHGRPTGSSNILSESENVIDDNITDDDEHLYILSKQKCAPALHTYEARETLTRMSKSNTHNKKRNTGLIYEFLVRTISSALVEGDKKKSSTALKILKRHFKPGTELYKEFRLINSLVKTTVSSDAVAGSILSEAKQAARKHDLSALDREKSILIKHINYTLGNEDFYDQQINEYRTYATVQVLLNEWRTKEVSDIGKVASYEDQLVKWLTNRKVQQEEQVIAEDNAGTSRLLMKIMTKKLNEKYSGILDENQRALIKSYVFSTANQDPTIIKNKLAEIKSDLLESIDQYVENNPGNEYIVNKMDEARDKLLSESIDNVDDDVVTRFMLYTRLSTEINSEELPDERSQTSQHV